MVGVDASPTIKLPSSPSVKFRVWRAGFYFSWFLGWFILKIRSMRWLVVWTFFYCSITCIKLMWGSGRENRDQNLDQKLNFIRRKQTSSDQGGYFKISRITIPLPPSLPTSQKLTSVMARNIFQELQRQITLWRSNWVVKLSHDPRVQTWRSANVNLSEGVRIVA